MKRLLVAILLCATLLTGCRPDDLVLWSPDGKQVAILASDGLRVGDETGSVSAPVLTNVEMCRWLPDSVHAIVVSTKETTSWRDIQGLLSLSERIRISQLGDTMWRSGSAARWKNLDTSLLSEILIYLNYRYGAKLVKAKLATRLKISFGSCARVTIRSLQMFDVSNKNPLAGAELLRTIKSIGDLRISPSGTLAAVSVNDDFGCKIIVVPLRGGESKTAVKSLADFPDWSVDGKSLFYIAYAAPFDRPPGSNKVYDSQHPSIATLNRQEVVDSSGVLLTRFPAAQALVEVLAADSSRVRCLPDGSVVFNSKERSFPSIKKSEHLGGLFKLSPDLKSVEAIAAAAELPDDQLECFEPNQDGTKIAVSGSHGEISVLDVCSGVVTVLEKASTDQLKFAPHWRTKEELSYPARNREKTANGHDIDVVLQSFTDPNRRIILSKDWPAAFFQFLRDGEKARAKGKSRAKLTKSSE